MKAYNPNPRGAEWKKWDLHVHSDASPDSKLVPANIIDKMVEKGIQVFAITDHSCVDNIDVFSEIVTQKQKEGVNIYFLPGIEFKTDKGDKSVHLIGIFPESDKNGHRITSAYLRENILSPLGCTESKLLDLGKEKLGAGKSNEEYRKRGLREFTLNFEQVAEKIKEIGGVRIVHAGSKSSSIENEMDHAKTADDNELLNTLGHLKETLMKDHIDICELPNFNDASAKQRDFYLKQFCKPSIVCSDSHEIGKIGSKFTWIKSDPTFEGLRQILYEPFDRVCLQENKPGKQLSYLIIDQVLFKDNISKRFITDSIPLNENLNVIIGGKSSGKSLLLHHIAKTIDRSQVQQKNKIIGSPGYDFDSDDGFDFEVVWCDGIKASLKDAGGSDGRQVTFIPQMFINHLAEEKGEQQLKNLIDQILEQNVEYQVFLESAKAAILENNAQISQLLGSLMNLQDSHSSVIREIKEIGDKKAIEAQADEIIKQIDLLTLASGFTAEESTEYERLMGLRLSHEDKITRFNSIKETLESYKTQTTGFIKETAVSNFEKFTSEFSQHLHNDKLATRLFDRLTIRKQAVLSAFLVEYEKADTDLSDILNAKVEKHKLLREQYNAQLAPFLAKVTNQEQLKVLQRLLLSEQAKISKIAEKEKKQSEISEREKNTKKQLFENYATLHQGYLSIVDKLANPPFNKITSDLELKTQLVVDVNRFGQTFCALFDRRSNFDTAFGPYFKNNDYHYERDHHDVNMSLIFEKLLQLDQIGLRLKNERTVRDAAQNLLGDYFDIKYTVKQGNDDITKMSPGKRGLVLLQLILHLSNASHPILIDQPEDNLDNRTVYAELNQFIKEKKLQRQIIFATHNANLVVSTDAENVIVANQAGQYADKDNKQFQFEYVSGSLEFSFRDDTAQGILYQMGISEHVCEILEGGKEAFEKRERKYGFK